MKIDAINKSEDLVGSKTGMKIDAINKSEDLVGSKTVMKIGTEMRAQNNLEHPVLPKKKEPKKKKIVPERPKSNLFKFIKKETKIISDDQKNDQIKNEKFTAVQFPTNSVVYRTGLKVKSPRNYTKGEKLTYIKFHDTFKPAFHSEHEKLYFRNSVIRNKNILDYDEDSELYFEDEDTGESINYASQSEESTPETDSDDFSLFESDENEYKRPKNTKFRMIFPQTAIQFKKDPKLFGFFSS
ncbi:putative Chromatin assembly factor 1 subunit A protein [Pseudoloma neurophilia]|uniref:Putative Chromatin assembly factor 1 subunit A protein n=1 Tax=Pseudoloma neurophilia TaxID=146866 RepID=A0A0R0M286_9MICR|nr:putative Chromatin assembly factor 1 subunit A protein [Pseudoloma neurophilia]